MVRVWERTTKVLEGIEHQLKSKVVFAYLNGKLPRSLIDGATRSPQRPAQKSLYERLGGYNAIAAVVDDALPRVVNDPKLARYFVGLSTNSKQRVRELLVDLICTATSGPCVYIGRDMKTSHAGLGINESEFQAFATDVIASLDKFKVPKKEKDELVSIVASLKREIVEKR